MILKCNSEDVTKARIGKSSFLISAVSKNLVVGVFFVFFLFFFVLLLLLLFVLFFFSEYVPWYFNCGRAFIDLRESTVI